MPAVRLRDKRIWIDQETRPLLSGEIHFWRLDPSAWPAVLDRSRELGLEIVSTYVCWDFHELRPGEFDFTGGTNPRRNLLGFIELVRDCGLWLLLRPGPYIYAEWPNSGVPERTVRWHRLHSNFIDEAKVWMRAVIDATRAYLGAPIVLVQADNEADPWFDVYGAQLGLAATPGLFQDFLQTRYAHIADLNLAWTSNCAHFGDCRAVLTPAVERFLPRYLDVARFRHWYATEVVRWTTAEYRRLGVDVPIFANTYQDTVVQDLRAIEAACDLAGPDLYPTARLADDPDEHRRLLEAVRYAHSCSSLPFIPEFEAGVWHGWHSGVGIPPATHYELTAFSALQGGAAGWNWYMLASRDSWYMSPITELGRFRPDLTDTFAEVARLYRSLDPASLSHVCDTAVTFNALERGASRVESHVLRALYEADIDYEFLDLDAPLIQKPLTFYGGGAILSPDQTQALIDCVEGGGTLVVFQPVETFPLARKPTRVSTAAAPQRVRLNIAGVELSSPSVFVYADGPGEPITAERIEPLPPIQEGGQRHVRLPIGERMTVGYTEERRSGRLIVLGVSPTPELLIALHGWLGVRVPCHAGIGTRVQSALFRRDPTCFAIVTNTNSHPSDVRLYVDLGVPLNAAHDLRTGAELPTSPNSVMLRVPARAGAAVQLV